MDVHDKSSNKGNEDSLSKLRSQVDKILKRELIDYMPTIDEADQEPDISIQEPLERYNTCTLYNKHINDDPSISITDIEPIEFRISKDDSSLNLNSNYSTRAARVINIQEASKFFKETQKLNEELWEAIESDDLDDVIKLLNHSQPVYMIPQVNAPGLNNWTALHMAASRGYKKICKVLLLCEGKPCVNARTSMNRTPLHLAVIQNHYKVVKLLLDFSAKIDLVDNDFNTALHYAANQGYENIVELLLIYSANPGMRNIYGRTPADIALNYETILKFYQFYQEKNEEIPMTGYSRQIFFKTLRHNSREDQVNKLLLKSKIEPTQNDIKLFNERPKIQIAVKKKPIVFKIPESKVGPKDFTATMQLGKGSFGSVYLVEKNDTKELFALKVLDKEKIIQRRMERYAFTERNILLRLNHPFIVKLHYAFQTPEKLALIMDYCPNGDLSNILTREKILNEDAARFYISEIILGIQALHKEDILFRDLKPENILIDETGHIKITDFGLSKENMNSKKLTTSFCGSAAYFAPEMIKREGHTKSIDWYILGAILYEMLSGEPPYYHPVREMLYKNIKSAPLRFKSLISEEAKDLISKLLIRNPKKRLGASKYDAEEIKAHKFFESIDWGMMMLKEYSPPPFRKILRVPKKIPLNKIYGMIDERQIEESKKIDGWSVLE
ncbi:hypothetical protein SteCoe_9064 [Stentor coeruleus]|uniref:Protein kinase domain-containing protein n=1 Tax=Stentor coeruleus TaxID=5963 RepID=A0A1R2CIT4_9CILI|nr:hypothetical protein SteCoe_9064 [Stentor coeruleus]